MLAALPPGRALDAACGTGRHAGHLADLGAVFAELARVLRPGGTLIVSDPHPTSAHFGGVATFPDRDHAPENGLRLPFVENRAHPIHTYVNSAVAAGLRIDECVEVEFPDDALADNPASAVLPDAVRQAFGGLPFLLVWRCAKLRGER